jgi:hypothetical protein
MYSSCSKEKNSCSKERQFDGTASDSQHVAHLKTGYSQLVNQNSHGITLHNTNISINSTVAI